MNSTSRLRGTPVPLNKCELMTQWLQLSLIVAVTLIPGMAIGSLTGASIKGWYKGLNKPKWTPPNWLFAPVWTVLYLSMSVALWLVLQAEPGFLWAQRLYYLQLFVNFSWTPVFFLFQKPRWALYIIVLLDVLVGVTTVLFFTVSVTAGKLMLPYLAWLGLATLLNFEIDRRN